MKTYRFLLNGLEQLLVGFHITECDPPLLVARSWLKLLLFPILTLLVTANSAPAYPLLKATKAYPFGVTFNGAALLSYQDDSGQFRLFGAAVSAAAVGPAGWGPLDCYLASPDQSICPQPSPVITTSVTSFPAGIAMATLGDKLYAAWGAEETAGRNPGPRPAKFAISANGVTFSQPIGFAANEPFNCSGIPGLASYLDISFDRGPPTPKGLAFACLDETSQEILYTYTPAGGLATVVPGENFGTTVLRIPIERPLGEGDFRASGLVFLASGPEPSTGTFHAGELLAAFRMCDTHSVACLIQVQHLRGNRAGDVPFETVRIAPRIPDSQPFLRGDTLLPSSPSIHLDSHGGLIVSWVESDGKIQVAAPGFFGFEGVLTVGLVQPKTSSGQFPNSHYFARPSLFDLDGEAALVWTGDDGHINVLPKVVRGPSDRPVIFVAGAAGSSLFEGSTEIWPGCPEFIGDDSRRKLMMAPDDASGRSYHSTFPLYPKDIIRTIVCFDNPVADGFWDLWTFLDEVTPLGFLLRPLGASPVDRTSTQYETLIGTLLKFGYTQYNDHGNPIERTESGCDLSQDNATHRPNLFVFPYDWRQDNGNNADLLRDFVNCVRRFHPGQEVDVVAHSMGGIVARQLILKGDHHVAHLATIGTPWLGAPKFPYVLLSGNFVESLRLAQSLVRDIVTFMPGLHQLIPTPAYFDLLGRPDNSHYWQNLWPVAEKGLDYNGDGKLNQVYGDFPTFRDALNGAFPPASHPGTNTEVFHNQIGQDDWRVDASGVKYLHVVGVQSFPNTVTQVELDQERFCQFVPPADDSNTAPKDILICGEPELVVTRKMGVGDGTVPLLSSSRLGANYGEMRDKVFKIDQVPPIGDANLNSPGATILPVFGSSYSGPSANDMAEHTGMTANPDVIRAILDFFADSPTGGQTQQALTLQEPASVIDSYELLITGFDSVVVSNDLGQSFDAMTSSESHLPGTTSMIAGPRISQLMLAGNTHYELRLRSIGTPVQLEFIRHSSGEIIEAVRYRDLILSAGETVALTLESAASPVLKRDANRDGRFESALVPTVSLSGPTAQDTTAPSIEVLAVGGQLSVQARDSESGVKAIYASYDGHTFFSYSTPLSRALIRGDKLHLIADDFAGNRAVSDPVFLAGDLNSDGNVDCRDLGVVITSFGRHFGEIGFDGRGDVNIDNAVDAKDLNFISQMLSTERSCDTTPPVIVPQISGTLGSNGWYTSIVAVAWNLSDPESEIASSSKCATTALAAETAGIALTCSATNGVNLSSSIMVTIKIDKTAPVVVSPPSRTVLQTIPAGSVVTYSTPIITENGSGIASFGCLPMSGSIFALGVTTVTCMASDRAGNTAASKFNVTVIPAARDGRMYGTGFVNQGSQHHHFVFQVVQARSRDFGRLEYWVADPRVCRDDDYDYDRDFAGDHDRDYGRDHHKPQNHFEATSFETIAFSDDPRFKSGSGRQPNVDAVLVIGSGEWNGRTGYSFEMVAADQGEPSRHRDVFSLTIKDQKGVVVAEVSGDLDGGNIQSIRIGR